MSHKLKEKALLIADAHYPHFGSEFTLILEAIKLKKIEVSQLILVGDIFDLLFGCGEYIKSFSKDAIKLLNEISNELEVIYLEGNHDFYLKPLFPNIKIYPRALQPIKLELAQKRGMISHGDKFKTSFFYEVYSFLIRHKVILKILKIAEKFVIDKNIEHLKSKNICKKFKGFETRVQEILSFYPKNLDFVIEGHYHQGVKIKNYISLPSLACQKEVGVVKDGEIIFVKVKDFLKGRV
jgi:UDP-2,3-diacylglucosamine hydrolase